MDKTYRRCYIAFLDILGFKELIKKFSCQEILGIFDKIRIPFSSMYITDQGKYKEIAAFKHVHMKVMSDSICFYIEADIENAFNCLISCCAGFQADLLSLETPILIRGGIVVGDIYAEGDTIFGPGLTEAYLLEEMNAKYPRIILTRNVVDQGNANSELLARETEYNLVNKDFDGFYVVNSLGFLELYNEGDIYMQKLKKYVDDVLGLR